MMRAETLKSLIKVIPNEAEIMTIYNKLNDIVICFKINNKRHWIQSAKLNETKNIVTKELI